jgi:hypothetical protein
MRTLRKSPWRSTQLMRSLSPQSCIIQDTEQLTAFKPHALVPPPHRHPTNGFDSSQVHMLALASLHHSTTFYINCEPWQQMSDVVSTQLLQQAPALWTPGHLRHLRHPQLPQERERKREREILRLEILQLEILDSAQHTSAPNQPFRVAQHMGLIQVVANRCPLSPQPQQPDHFLRRSFEAH